METKQTGFLRLPQILELFPIGKSSWWAGVKAGRFPKAIKLSSRTTVWLASEIFAFIESQRKAEA